MTEVTSENLAELRTELEVLALFDVYRAQEGNDRGKAQRRKELDRRRLELEPFEAGTTRPSLRELEETMLRLRAERGHRGGEAHAAAWRALRRDLAAAADVDETRTMIALAAEKANAGE